MKETQFFNKVACFTDIHFGNKNNSRQHNDDCSNFIDWFIEQALDNECDTCIFLGDWHHHRSAINVSTLNYTVPNIEKLSRAFKNVYMIMGNHDLYYREKRDLNSVPYADLHDNVHIVNDNFIVQDGVALVPWLVEDEWKSIKDIQAKYVFGHFELPTFLLNAMIEMPDHGGLTTKDFNNKTDYIFSGHFHKRQNNGKIHYIGNAFPHNYSDAWDDARGMMILEWGGEPEYIDWPDCPRYRTLPLSKLIDSPDKYLNENTYCRVTLDVPISYEEANFIKETFAEQYKLREISLMPAKKEEHSTEWKADGDILVENVDQIVYNQLQAVDSDIINSKTLIEIYNNL